MDRIFETLIVAIIALGTGHTMSTIYRERQDYRRWREAVKRLKFGESNTSN